MIVEERFGVLAWLLLLFPESQMKNFTCDVMISEQVVGELSQVCD